MTHALEQTIDRQNKLAMHFTNEFQRKSKFPVIENFCNELRFLY